MKKKFKILIVDDDHDIRTLLKELLSNNDELEVDTAVDGFDGLNKVKKIDYDLVISDIKMPTMDGIELLQAIRKIKPGTPVVVMSAYAEFDSLVKVLQLGAMNFIKKPFDFDEIFQVVLKVIKIKDQFRSQSKIFPHVNIDTKITIPAKSDLIEGIIVYLTLDLNNYNVCSESDIGNIRLALHEALMNAVEHGNKFDESKQVMISKSISKNTIIFTIKDEGQGFSINNIPDPTLPENIMKPRGRGLLLIKSFVDKVDFNEQGNEVKLTKYFNVDEKNRN